MADDREELQRLKRRILHEIRTGNAGIEPDDAPAFSRVEFCIELLKELLVLTDGATAEEPEGDRELERAMHAMRLWAVFADELMRPIFEAVWGMIPRGDDDPNSRVGRTRLKWMLEFPDEMGTPIACDDLIHPTLMIPRAYHSRLLLALEALDFGEIQPILAPEKKRKHGQPYTWLRMKMFAIRHVWFFQGQGNSQKEARERVARALSASIRTLRAWEEEELPHQVSNFDRERQIAKEAGEFFARRQDDPDEVKRRPVDPHVLGALKTLEPPALQELARKFRQMNGSRYWSYPGTEPAQATKSGRQSQRAKRRSPRAR